ncbi:putative lipid kinase [Roseimaritima multifibrata]|uniref:Putative lipid kinase n=1 Tax=Roseimaritima multifibrata TaxID=1930274 RepID=A0A517MCJ6_9BACT|nr:putative lipid kinase [Roseimaritima multifibrata]
MLPQDLPAGISRRLALNVNTTDTTAPVVLVCSSPKAGSGRNGHRMPLLLAALRKAGYDVHCHHQIDKVVEIAERLGPEGLRAVIPAGGDGTIRLVAEKLPASIPLVPFPLGTENLLARHFGFAADPKQTVQTVEHGPLYRMDAGSANGKLFLVMASCGFDAEVVRGMHLTRRGHIRRSSYIKPILRAVRNYSYPSIHVAPVAPTQQGGLEPSVDPPFVQNPGNPCSPASAPVVTNKLSGASVPAVGTDWLCRWALAFNLPCYGGGLQIDSEASEVDGRLDLTTLQNGSTWSTLRYVAGVFAGRHRRWTDVQHHLGKAWLLTSESRVNYQLDGDYTGRLPLRLECLPGRLTLRLPLTFGETKPVLDPSRQPASRVPDA